MAVRFGTPCPLPHPCVVLQEELESVQKRAARFVTGNYNYETGSMIDWYSRPIPTSCVITAEPVKEYDWHSWTVKMGIPQEKEKRQ